MNPSTRLDAIEAALNPCIDGEHFDRCGAPQRGDRRDMVRRFIGDTFGTCEF